MEWLITMAVARADEHAEFDRMLTVSSVDWVSIL